MKTKAILLLVLSILFPCFIYAQGGTWVWVKGPSTTGGTATYGTQGVESASNNPQGLYEAPNWTDQQGNFWIFGGYDGTQEHSDLWKFNPSTGNWTWMKGPGIGGQAGIYGTMGVPSPTNNPGARAWGCVSWTDLSGNLWLYGGDGTGGFLSDMWKYNIATNEWTWISGSDVAGVTPSYGTLGVESGTNTPGGRAESTSDWVDADGNLWFFGGDDAGFYNDLWKYDLETNQWVWMNGPQGIGNAGSYGTRGVASTSNVPPSRASYSHWTDASGNFYLFGGYNGSEPISDVWQYNPVNNEWTWVAGENTTGSAGSYNDYCIANGYTGPMARYENRTAQVSGCSTNAFLSFGGSTQDGFGVYYEVNDLWMFNAENNQWTWVSGNNVIGNPGSYGTLGVASTTNQPPARAGHCLWMDNSGNLWVFGGTINLSGYYSDMWKFTANPSCISVPLAGGINTHLQQNIICKGDSTKLSITGASNIHISPAGSVTLIDTADAYLAPDTTTTYLITGNSNCRSNDTAYVTLTVTRPGALNYLLSDTSTCEGVSAELTLIGQVNMVITPTSGVSWQDSSHALISPATTTTYHIKGTSTLCGGSDSAQFTIHVVQHNPVNITIPDSVVCYDNTLVVSITGLSNVTVTSPTSYTIEDSALIYFYGYSVGTYNYVIGGTTSCGSHYSDSFTLKWVEPGVLNYTISKPEICEGDSDLITLSGATGTYITPSTGVRWIDSTHIMVHPDTNTVYHIYGYSVCSGADSATVTVRVIQPGIVNYTLSTPILCTGGGYTYLYLYGLKNVSITPAPYYIYYTDSLDSYSELYVYSTTTYTVIGQSECGGWDTNHITIPVEPYPSYVLSKSFMCLGDSATGVFTGIENMVITPSANVTRIDSTTYMFHPGTTTTYVITGLTCSGAVNYVVTLQVGLPGHVNYTLSPPGGVCSGGDEYLNIYGVLNPQITPFTSLYEVDSDQFYGYLYPVGNTTYTITGASVCGGPDTTKFTVNVLPYENYILSKNYICSSDSTLLTLYGLRSLSITPSGGVAWIDSSFDSSHVYLHPAVTTTYQVSGINCSGYSTYYSFTVNVVAPGVLDYTVSPLSVCVGGDSYLNLYGATSAQISPTGTLYWTTSTQAYSYLYTDTTTTYRLSALTVCGQRDTAYFTVTALPEPGYTLAPSSVCKGDSSLLTITGLKNAVITPLTGVRWIDSAHVMLSPDTNTTYTLYGTSCSGYTSEYTIEVYVVRPGTVDYTVSSNSICSGYYSYLYVYGLYNVQISPTVSYLYKVDSTQYDADLYPTVNTTYTITGTSVCGGKDTARVTVDVNSEPGYTVSQTLLCNGDSAIVTFTGLSDFQITPVNHVTWIDSSHVSLKPDSTGYYYITAYSPCTGSYYIDLYLQVGQGGKLDYTVSDSVVCPGGEIYLTTTGITNPVITPSAYFYNSGTYYYTYLYPTGNTTYTITGTSICGGYDTAVFNAYVSGEGYFVLANPAICAGDSTEIFLNGLTAAQITPSTSVDWQGGMAAWLKPDTTTVYTITGTTACSGSYYQPVTVVVSSPAVAVSASATTICSDDTAEVCATTGFDHYHWNTGQTTDCIEVNTTGNYYVTVVDANGCSAVSPPVHINVLQVTPAVITQHGDSLIVPIGSTYQWYLNGVLIPGAVSRVYVATVPGSYTVVVIGKNCGPVTSAPVVITATGLNDLTIGDINIYPNPSAGSWFLEVGPGLVGNGFEVYDAEGRLVYQSEIRNQVSEISLFASGVYFMRINCANGNVVRKLVKL